MHYPTIHLRQTAEGTLQIGSSHEDVGQNEGTLLSVKKTTARRSCTNPPAASGCGAGLSAIHGAGLRSSLGRGAACLRPACDSWGTTSLGQAAVAGDGARILGSLAAEASGALAALETARRLGRIDERKRDGLARPWRSALARQAAIRPFLDRLYRPAQGFFCPPDRVFVCRCEEVTAGEICNFAALGCPGPNQAKSFTHCGMGPCQGRLCSLTVTALFAEVRDGPRKRWVSTAYVTRSRP